MQCDSLDSHSLLLVLIGRHLALAIWLKSTPARISPWFFPAVACNTGSRFWALSLPSGSLELGSKVGEHTVFPKDGCRGEKHSVLLCLVL